MKNKFLQISLGVSLMLFSAGFLVRSVGSANAMPTPDKFIDQGGNQMGRYMMDCFFSPAYKDENGAFYAPVQYTTVWDSQTGKSIGYYYSGGWQKCAPAGQLPASPIQ